jgi:hypothetical protein
MLWLKQKISPDLVPIMTFVHDPVKGIYPAIRWMRPDEPMPEMHEHALQPWMRLEDALHRYAFRLYNKSDHRLHGSHDLMETLIQIAELLPEGHPLRERATKVALLHACLLEGKKHRLSSDMWAWFEKNIKEMGSKLPPLPETEPETEPKTEPKPETKPKSETAPVRAIKPRKRLRLKPAKQFSKIELEPVSMSYYDAKDLVQKQWSGLVRKWLMWARRKYGSSYPPDIKHGIVTKLTKKLIADREFVEAFINSPLSPHYATVDDALKDEERLREVVYGFIDGFVGAWAQTASDHHPLVWALQIAIAQEFGLRDRYRAMVERLKEVSKSDEEPLLLEQTAFIYDTLKPILHKYVRAVYDETQEFIKKAGFEELYLARGVGLTEAQAADLPLDEFKLVEQPMLPASSWSLDFATAEWFANWMARKYNLKPALYIIRLPKEAFHLIISAALSGFGCFDEKEFVLAVPYGQEVWAARLK